MTGSDDRAGRTGKGAESDEVVRFLTGEMDGRERAEFEQRIGADPSLAREVESMALVVGRLESMPGEAWDPPQPPAFDRSLFSDPRATGSPTGKRRKRSRSLWPSGGFGWPQAIAGGLAAVVLFAAGTLLGTSLGEDGPSPAVEEQLALSGIGPEAPSSASGEVSLVSSGSDRLRLSVSGLNETGSREFYELWLMGKDGELVALGSFRVGPDGSSEIEVPVPVDPDRYRYYDVSIQPENGSPKHSGRSVLRGLTRS